MAVKEEGIQRESEFRGNFDKGIEEERIGIGNGPEKVACIGN